MTELILQTSVVVLFMAYMTLLNVSAKLLRCEDIWSGLASDEPRSVLVADMSIDCSSSQYLRYRAAAQVAIVAVGLGIPFISVLVIKLVQFLILSGSKEGADTLFFFMTGGYKKHLWFWEAVVTARKGILVMASVLIEDVRFRGYACLWTILLSLLVHCTWLPYTDPALVGLERRSMSSVGITFATLIFLRDVLEMDAISTHESNVAVLIGTIVLITVNSLSFLDFFRMMSWAGREFGIRFARNNPKFAWMLNHLEAQPAAKATQRLQDEVTKLLTGLKTVNSRQFVVDSAHEILCRRAELRDPDTIEANEQKELRARVLVDHRRTRYTFLALQAARPVDDPQVLTAFAELQRLELELARLAIMAAHEIRIEQSATTGAVNLVSELPAIE